MYVCTYIYICVCVGVCKFFCSALCVSLSTCKYIRKPNYQNLALTTLAWFKNKNEMKLINIAIQSEIEFDKYLLYISCYGNQLNNI